MKRTVFLSLIALVLGLTVLHAEVYRVRVTRIDSNLYRELGSKAIIETRFCFEFAIDDKAVLKWEGRYGDNWIIFSNNAKCDVVSVR